MLIDNKYTTKHPCIAANYNIYQPHTGKREHRERHQPVFSNSHLTDTTSPLRDATPGDRHAPDIDFMFTLNQGKVEREHEVSLSH